MGKVGGQLAHHTKIAMYWIPRSIRRLFVGWDNVKMGNRPHRVIVVLGNGWATRRAMATPQMALNG
jgi:hypothetical protein